jgi:hypothetical protein
MAHELLFGGIDPLHILTDLIETMATSQKAIRDAYVEGLSDAFHAAGLCRADANIVAFQMGEIAERQRLADHYEPMINAAKAA